MLHVYFSRLSEFDSVLTPDNYRLNPTLWFDNQGGEDYIYDDISKAIIEDIDNTIMTEQGVLINRIYGSCTPREISGTAKTLILLYNEPEFYYNGAHLGENVAPWLLKFGKEKDIYVRLGYAI